MIDKVRINLITPSADEINEAVPTAVAAPLARPTPNTGRAQSHDALNQRSSQ